MEAPARLEKLKHELAAARHQHASIMDERRGSFAAVERISQAIAESLQEINRLTQSACESEDVKNGVLSVDPRITRLKDEIAFGNDALEQARTRAATLERAESTALAQVSSLTRQMPECMSRVAMIQILDSIDMGTIALAAASTHNPRQYVIDIPEEYFNGAKSRITDEINGVTG